jgi:hypothetical protein
MFCSDEGACVRFGGERAMSTTSRIVAAIMIGLAVTGCGLTRQAEQRRDVFADAEFAR